MDQPAIDLHGLGKRFGSFDAVRDLTLRVERGELLALLGPNGAGKTTTMRMLMGVLRASAGTARVFGLDCFAERPEVMRRVGYVPDEPAFYDYLRGSELIAFVGAMHGLAKEEVRRRGGAWAERLQLSDALDEFATNYSKGMRKKLALLLALLHEPELLILDEPTNGLDPHATRDLHEVILARRSAGQTVLFSTHLLDQAEKLADRAAIISGGRLGAIGPVGELRERLAAGGNLEDVFFAVTAADGATP